MFGLSIDDTTHVFCDNKSVCENNVYPESTLSKDHHLIAYQICREAVAAKTIWVSKEETCSPNLCQNPDKLLL